MNSIKVLLAVLGSGITLMIGVGMLLIVRGGAEAHPQTPHAHFGGHRDLTLRRQSGGLAGNTGR